MNPELNLAERSLYDRDKFAWSVYTCMKYASRDAKKQLWNLLTDEQKNELKILAGLR